MITYYGITFFYEFIADTIGRTRNYTDPVAEFIVPDWEDKVNFGIGLYQPARLHRLAGRYDNPMPEFIIYSSGCGIWRERGRECTPLSASWAENTIMTDCTQGSGHLQSMYSLVCVTTTP
jgi:hypothetical protein